MGNAIRGVVDLVTSEKIYKVKFGMNAIIEVEEAFDNDIEQVFKEVAESRRMKPVRLCMWAGLQDFHPDLSEKDAGNIVDEVGIEEAISVLLKAVQAATPKQDQQGDGVRRKGKKAPGGEEEHEKNPPPAAGSGSLSS